MTDAVSVDGSPLGEQPLGEQPLGEKMGYPALESCSFVWLFDPRRRRFRRVPRGVAPELAGANGWLRYHRLDIQPERAAFVVTLDRGGTRTLRSWLHGDHHRCRRCGAGGDGERR